MAEDSAPFEVRIGEHTVMLPGPRSHWAEDRERTTTPEQRLRSMKTLVRVLRRRLEEEDPGGVMRASLQAKAAMHPSGKDGNDPAQPAREDGSASLPLVESMHGSQVIKSSKGDNGENTAAEQSPASGEGKERENELKAAETHIPTSKAGDGSEGIGTPSAASKRSHDRAIERANIVAADPVPISVANPTKLTLVWDRARNLRSMEAIDKDFEAKVVALIEQGGLEWHDQVLQCHYDPRDVEHEEIWRDLIRT